MQPACPLMTQRGSQRLHHLKSAQAILSEPTSSFDRFFSSSEVVQE
jgi:hypothetical protein